MNNVLPTRAKWEPVLFIAAFFAIGAMFAVPMGLANMISTMMNTAYKLLVDTALYIMAIAVITCALSALLTEFGVTAFLNRLLSPLMWPLYHLPGAAALGIVTTYFSDNPAILSLADDADFKKYFKKYQMPALTNVGTSYGMGLIVSMFMLNLGMAIKQNLTVAVVVGNLAAVIGSIVSTRLMLRFTARKMGTEAPAEIKTILKEQGCQKAPAEKLGVRMLNAVLSGGKQGIKLGSGIIPGVLTICTLVLMLTNGAGANGKYTGAAFEGIALLPYIAEKLQFLLVPLFGLASAKAVVVPITALGSAGAAIGLVPQLLNNGFANTHDVAVFTAMCMCWSGYLSTHVSMMDSLGCSELSGKAILSQTIGGICAGIAANWIYTGLQVFL